MDIAILSVSLNVYSTSRIAEEFEKAGHYVEHIDHTKCSVQLGDERPQIFYEADNITDEFDAIVCLGAVIRGETPHFDYVSSNAAGGIASVSLDSGIPVSFGILTTDTIEQAIERSGTKSGNQGRDATVTAMEMASLLSKL